MNIALAIYIVSIIALILAGFVVLLLGAITGNVCDLLKVRRFKIEAEIEAIRETTKRENERHDRHFSTPTRSAEPRTREAQQA